MRRFALVLFLIPLLVAGGSLDRIRRAIEKEEFEKAFELIQKTRQKEPENPGLDFFSAQLFFIQNYSRFNPDSARIAISEALKKHRQASTELIEDLAEDGVTLEKITQLSDGIRDHIYINTQNSISVETAERFMRTYPGSPYQEILTFKRDSIVFERVKRNDELDVYEDFLTKYSTPEFREEASRRIDELRYQVLRHSGSLPDYYQFLEKHPETRFRDPIEHYIFKRSTADHRPESYLQSIAFSQSPSLKKKAADILYHHSNTRGTYRHFLSDSIAEVRKGDQLQLIPAMENGRFGFHSVDGQQRIPYLFSNVEYTYKCEVTSDDWLFVSSDDESKIIDKLGRPVISGIEAYEDLSDGLGKVRQGGDWYLYHKSGFRIIDHPITDAEVLNGRWIKVLQKGKWALVSYSGHEITKYEFDDIRLLGNYWVFEREGLLAVYTEKLIEQELNQNGLELEFKFDDLELINDNMLIGFREDRECMLDGTLRFLIPWGNYEINPDPSGWYLKTSNGYRLYDSSEQDIMNKVHPYLETNSGWLALKTESDWMLLPRGKSVLPSRGYDSLKLVNDHAAISLKEEGRLLHFANGITVPVSESETISTFQNNNSYVLKSGKERIIYDSLGSEILQGAFEQISFFNDTLLKVVLKKKTGLISLKNEFVLKPIYDALDESEGLIQLLQGGKIGCLDLQNEVEMEPTYASRIERLGANYVTKKGEFYGVIDANEETVVSFLYDEIRTWNDTAFVAREANQWLFVNYNDEEVWESVDYLTEVVSSEKESIWKFIKDGKYGLLSNRNGILLNPEFTDVFNIGEPEKPIFFADQHLDKAGFHVVSYVDENGELLFSKAYEKIEFDLILCDD